jgi:hypothetical protein
LASNSLLSNSCSTFLTDIFEPFSSDTTMFSPSLNYKLCSKREYILLFQVECFKHSRYLRTESRNNLLCLTDVLNLRYS